jgi:hypothetical protein
MIQEQAKEEAKELGKYGFKFLKAASACIQ